MELFDLYTKDRERTGKTIVRGTAVPDGYMRMVVHICIFNSRGEMLIQRRQLTKLVAPGQWDTSVAGSVAAGESSRVTAHREIAEEIGYSVPFEELMPLLTYNLPDVFDDFYVIRRDIDISELTLQKEEVMDVKWAGKDEILAMMKTGEFIEYPEHLIRLLFAEGCGE